MSHTRLKTERQRFLIHPRDHENFTADDITRNSGNQSVSVERWLEDCSFLNDLLIAVARTHQLVPREPHEALFEPIIRLKISDETVGEGGNA